MKRYLIPYLFLQFIVIVFFILCLYLSVFQFKNINYFLLFALFIVLDMVLVIRDFKKYYDFVVNKKMPEGNTK